MSFIPSPHPLDFDWRFDRATTRALCEMLRSDNPLSALGAPTVARRLQMEGRDITLVDRQPILGITNHIVSDLAEFEPKLIGGTVLVDPPWYPDILERWVAIGAQMVGRGGSILVSTWPPWTRPSARAELDLCLGWIKQWADIEPIPLELVYDLPRFEKVATEVCKDPTLATSPRRGVLLRLKVLATPDMLLPMVRPFLWQRFILEDYQLALRLGKPDAEDVRLVPHANSCDWRWPYVSARAPGLAEIDLWSSDGEVAVVRSPGKMVRLLKRAFASADATEFEMLLKTVPELLSWNIPRPPFRSKIEWQHRQ